MLHEEIADLRHKETEAYIGCIMGFVIFLAGLVIRLPSTSSSGMVNLILMGGGFMLIMVSGISSQYYSNKRKSLMKKSNVPNIVVPQTVVPPPYQISVLHVIMYWHSLKNTRLGTALTAKSTGKT